MTQRIITTRTRRTDPLPPRWRRLVTLLEGHPRLTAKEIAVRLGVSTRTARTYLSEVARYVTIKGEGEVGDTRYFLDAIQED